MDWPDEIWIGDPSWMNESQLTREADVSSFFCRELKDCGIRDAAFAEMIRICNYRFNCLIMLRSKYRETYSLIDQYNAAWASIGYEDGMSDTVLELAHKRFGKPYER